MKRRIRRRNHAKAGPPTRQVRRPSPSTRAVRRIPPARRGPEVCRAVIGIGASAGGFDALRRLFSAARSDSGAAFVVVEHLDPVQKSLAAEVIGRYTPMPVVQVVSDMPVKANHVYVIPPGKYLSIGGGTLRLIAPVEPGGIRMPIDLFLRALAADSEERAVGIVLSGTGTDGTLGLKAIKVAGGMSIAQEPGTAQHDGMPGSAIAAGAVDQVLPPERMAEAVLTFLGHSYTRRADGPRAVERVSDHLNDVIAILRERARFDFRSYKTSTLERRIHRRMGGPAQPVEESKRRSRSRVAAVPEPRRD